MLGAIERFFVTWRFAVFAICLLTGFAALVGGLLWIPPAPSGLGAFAEEFRVWCFGADATSAGASPLLKFGLFFELLSLAGLIALVWLQPIRAQLRNSAGPFLPFASAGLAVVALLAGGLWWLGGPTADPTVFPARELRTHWPAPPLTLVDQTGGEVSLEALRGQVVVVTAVYATCGLACPRILGQVKRVASGLTPDERQGLTVLGITLDPEHDDVAALGRLAQAQHVEAPLYRLLTGEAAAVNTALDRFGVQRQRNQQTGLIDHSNLFVVIDRRGQVAYHFTLSDLQERWMQQAVRLLLEEPPATKTARRD